MVGDEFFPVYDPPRKITIKIVHTVICMVGVIVKTCKMKTEIEPIF